MYLTKTSSLDLVKKQLLYKYKANTSFFFSLVLVQALALLFSFNGVMQMGSGSNMFSLTIKAYSSEIIIFFTIFWSFIVAITLTTKVHRYSDFTFVSNRVSSNLSTIAFLVSLSVIGSITALFSGILLRVIIYFSLGTTMTFGENYLISPQELLLAIFVTTLYSLLLSAIGYFLGMLVQLFKPLVVGLPLLIIGLLIMDKRINDTLSIGEFFVSEHSLVIFTIKVVLTAVLLFGASIILSNSMEVRN